MHAAGVLSTPAVLLKTYLLLQHMHTSHCSLIRLSFYEGSSFVVQLVSDLAIRDGGHCLHVFGTRLFTCKVSVAYLFLLGGWWFWLVVWYICGRYSEVTKESGQLASQAWGIKLTCVFCFWQTCTAGVFLWTCSLAHISTHSTVPHHRLRLTQIPWKEGIVHSLFYGVIQCICVSAALR